MGKPEHFNLKCGPTWARGPEPPQRMHGSSQGSSAWRVRGPCRAAATLPQLLTPMVTMETQPPPPASCLGLDNQAWPTSTETRPEPEPGRPWYGYRKNWDWVIWSVQASSTAWEDYHRSLHTLLPGLGSHRAQSDSSVDSRAHCVAWKPSAPWANSCCGAGALAAAGAASAPR